MPRVVPLLFIACVAPLIGAPLFGAPIFGASWISIKTGPFVVFSEGAPKETRERAAELEQFRFSLGELLGRHDLAIHPALQVFLFNQPPADSNERRTRTGAIALLQSIGPLTFETRRRVAHLLLDENVGRMPDSLERGLETFLSTTEVHGAKVNWGAPPPIERRDANWALVDWLVTNPETYGNMRVLLANLETHVEEGVAYRNALHQSRAEVEREVDSYLKAGHFRTIDGPSRPLSPERDLAVRTVTPDDLALHLADLLDNQSEQRYQAVLQSGVHKAEAEEGLALLALQRKDLPAASDLLKRALADGSKNAVAMVAYARLEPDPAKAQSILEAAVQADPNSAEAHFLIGQKLTEQAKQIQEWTLAAKLAPRNPEYWAALAQAFVNQKRWVEASNAFRNAEQAATTDDERDKLMEARMAIEGQRLDSEDAQRRAEKEAQEREIRRLKDQTIAELRSAEAKVNAGRSPADSANAVPWDQLDGAQPLTMEAQLIRVECVAGAKRVVLRTPDGKLLKLNSIPGKKDLPLTCGAQTDRPVTIAYNAKPNAKTGVAGDLVSIDPR